MKRFFFMTIALAVAAISCTKSGLLESPQTYETPISFEPYTGKVPVTKATVVETENIQDDGFRVIGFVEDDANANAINSSSPRLKRVVTFGDHDNDTDTPEEWYYHVPMYWEQGQDMTFVAYGLNVNANKTAVTTTGDIDENNTGNDNFKMAAADDYTKFTYTVPGTVAAQKDLVISPVMTDNNSTKGTIAVRLYHALSRIGFSVKTEGNSASSSTYVTINDVAIVGGFATSATFDLSKISAPAEGVKTLAYNLPNNEEEKPVNFTPAAPVRTEYQLLTAAYTNEGKTGTADQNNANIKTYTIYSGTEADRFMMIMPGAVGNVKDTEDIDEDQDTEELVSPYIRVKYQLPSAEDETTYIPLRTNTGTADDPVYENFTFAPGKAYEFVFTVSTVAVGFDVTVGIWEPKDGNTVKPEEETFPLN